MSEATEKPETEAQHALRVAFCWAARDGNTDVVEKLMEAGAVDSEHSCFRAIMLAAENGHAETVSLLLTKEDSMWAARSALHVAADNERTEALRVILDWMDKKQPARNTPKPPQPAL